jgi:D-glycero-D-manno-heptose 1,7-bisphosphate phosphatase
MPHDRKAAFLDRDGTIIEERHYIANPDQVVLTPRAAEGMRALRELGYKLVIVTNQSGIARGLYRIEDFQAVQARLEEILNEQGVEIDAVMFCPHHPDFTGPCDCRKPGPGMYREAQQKLGVDLAASVYIGDRLKDVLPAHNFGGTGILVRTGYGADEARRAPNWVIEVADLSVVPEVLKKPRRA